MKFGVVLLLILCIIPVKAQEQNVQINIDAPESVVAGNEMKITVTIDKGDLRDYSRFSQELPQGFTATNLSSPNADFTFTDQRVRIIWLKLPVEQVIRVVYMIAINERLKGELELGGTFAFVNEGERAFIDIPDNKVVTITPNPDIDPSLVVDISEFGDVVNGNTTNEDSQAITDEQQPVEEPEAFARIIRQKPIEAANGTVTVNMIVKKPEGTNFLKVEEYIPTGYSFEATEANNAVVSQSSSVARFVWMRPPDQVVFSLQYKLIPILEQEQGEMLIEGNMSFTESGSSEVESIRELDLDLSGLTMAQRLDLFEYGTVDGRKVPGAEDDDQSDQMADASTIEDEGETADQVAESDATDDEGGVADMGQASGQGGEEDLADNTSANEDNQGSATQQQDTDQQTQELVSQQSGSRYEGVYVKTRLKKIIRIEPLEDASGVYFRVQVGAILKPYFARVVYAEYDILRDVKCEYIDSWHKFTLGSFNTYQEATAYKTRILTETPTKSAFIVAYRDGNRVPLREVL